MIYGDSQLHTKTLESVLSNHIFHLLPFIFLFALGVLIYKIYNLLCLTLQKLLTHPIHVQGIRFLKQNLAYKGKAEHIYRGKSSHRLKLTGGREGKTALPVPFGGKTKPTWRPTGRFSSRTYNTSLPSLPISKMAVLCTT